MAIRQIIRRANKPNLTFLQPKYTNTISKISDPYESIKVTFLLSSFSIINLFIIIYKNRQDNFYFEYYFNKLNINRL